MSLEDINWAQVGNLSGGELKGEIFSILQQASAEIYRRDVDDPGLLAIVPRLAEYMETRPELESYREPFSSFARSVGLWNYIDRTVADARDELAAEVAEVPGLGIVLHREQLAALDTLLSGKNLILSAPTSFGKSILIDALLLHERFKRVAIVLPTIALLDEFRRRLVLRFSEKFDVLMHHSETSTRDRVIFLGTQERLINREDLGVLDLVVVDEFYKLDPARRDDRSVTLNAAVYKLLSKGRQFFFLGPNIESVQLTEGSRWKFEFLRTRFSTVAVDTFDLRAVEDKEERLLAEATKPSNWPALVFLSSPDKANKLAGEMVDRDLKVGDGTALSNWMQENYGGTWPLSRAVAAGIGVHHGRVPRALASRFVTLFNRKLLPVMICTSTLIEGVNTAAKSVLIYDKTINKRRFDFFTFSNIKGRAGRLGQHHVGQVFLFHAPPGQEDYGVSAPLFGELENAPDEFLVHMEESDTTPKTANRILEVAAKVGLSPQELRRFSTIGITTLEQFKLATEQALMDKQDVRWHGYPTYNQVHALLRIICSVFNPRDFGCASASQLALYVSQLRSASSMKAFYLWHSSSFRGDVERVDSVFKFLRALEFSLSEYMALVQVFVNKTDGQADFSLYLATVPRWFRAEELKILEEQGVPIQIAERFRQDGDDVTTLGHRLRTLAQASDPRMSELECEWILDALPG